MSISPSHAPLPAGARIAVLTSGGDAPGMNPALRAAVKMGIARRHAMLGVLNGYRGLIDGRARVLSSADVDGIERLGGTFLGSARALDFATPAGQAAATASIARLGIDALVVIGGNGSLAGAHAAASFSTAGDGRLRVVGIPASIDNDIGLTTSAIGVDSALNTIVEACDKIADTASSHNRAFLVEVMGRDCGYLAMAAAVATGADGVLFRESGRSDEELVGHVVRVIESAFHRDPPKPRVLILKAEGVRAPLAELKARIDAALAARRIGVETRITVLGHLVRGGAPTAQDRLMAGRLARAAMWALIEGHSDAMIAWQGGAAASDAAQVSPHDPYCAVVPIEAVLAETRALLDGTSALVRWRTRAIAEVEELLQL